ncbi:J domain-containing protein [Methylomonas sp. MgM2]
MLKHTPYQIIGVGEDAADAEIKQAYLQLAKRHPPDCDQLQFRRIRQAYELIKDEESRLHYALFDLPDIEFELLLDDAFRRETPAQAMAPGDFMQLFAEESVNSALAKSGR